MQMVQEEHLSHVAQELRSTKGRSKAVHLQTVPPSTMARLTLSRSPFGGDDPADKMNLWATVARRRGEPDHMQRVIKNKPVHSVSGSSIFDPVPGDLLEEP